ncbi:hypothetical protein V6N13_075527 [Hibiscus sabdariffa]|uniref:Uncharacterized protein n=2 Tax=Hibiscus sabdariffa TaxID=183260 RepID=A0ABR2UBU6_9ROSI
MNKKPWRKTHVRANHKQRNKAISLNPSVLTSNNHLGRLCGLVVESKGQEDGTDRGKVPSDSSLFGLDFCILSRHR